MRQVALITGASAGIGKELARVIARHGHDVILTARRTEELKALAEELIAQHKIQAHVFPADFSEPRAAQKLFEEIHRANLTVDILVNNAGFGVYGPFIEADVDRLLGMLQVNVLALTHLTRLFLPGMVARGRGRVLNVASVAAFQPGPLLAGYYATKAYVLSLSEALSFELRRTPVTVTCLCPGPTRTEFSSAAVMTDSKLFDSPGTMDAGPVAEAGVQGMLRGKRVVIPGFLNRVGAFLGRVAPRPIVLRYVNRLQGKRKAH